MRYAVRNVTRGTSIGDAIDCAESGAERRTGLLKHTKLGEGEGLWIVPCEAVHSFGMKFVFDIVYLNRKLQVRKLRSHMAPWRFSLCMTAYSVLELPAGTIANTQTQTGDRLKVTLKSGVNPS